MKPDRETTYAEPAGSRAGWFSRAGRAARLRDERGQSVTEFAMVMPLIALVVIVCVLLGKSLWVYIQLTHDANEAARVVSVNQPTSDFVSFLQNTYALPGGANVAICYPPNPSSNPPGSTRQIGDPVEVDVWTNANWVPFVTSTQLRGDATMRLEQATAGNLFLDPTTTYNAAKHQCNT